jgi:hypothetical protein
MLELLRTEGSSKFREVYAKHRAKNPGMLFTLANEIWQVDQATAIQVLEISAEMHPASAITRYPLLEGYAGGNTEKSLFNV